MIIIISEKKARSVDVSQTHGSRMLRHGLMVAASQPSDWHGVAVCSGQKSVSMRCKSLLLEGEKRDDLRSTTTACAIGLRYIGSDTLIGPTPRSRHRLRG